MLNCKGASQLISQSLDRRLTWSERVQLKFHLFICDACTRFNQQLIILRKALKKLTQHTENDTSIHLSKEAKVRITEHIHR